MAAFDFPNPPTPGQEVTNDATGITYKYDETTQSWSVVASTITDAYATSAELEAEASARTAADNSLSERIGAVENDYTTTEEYNNLKSDIRTAQQLAEKAEGDAAQAEAAAGDAQQTADSALSLAQANELTISNLPDGGSEIELSNYATKADLSQATAGLPYRLETDKTMRSLDLPVKTIADGDVAPAAAGGEIQLVDNLGFFYNVTFTGRHGIATSSTAAGIEVSAKDLKDRIEALEEAVQTLASLIPPVDIGNVTIESSADIEGGNAAAAQDEMFIMWAENDGETEYGLRYDWSIKRGNGRISSSNTGKTVTAWCSDPAPATVEFQCVVSHPAEPDAIAIATKLVLVADNA